jgi:TPR repeat protein
MHSIMKGERLYGLAQNLHQKMYGQSFEYDKENKLELYSEYFKLIKRAAYKGHVESLYNMGQQYEDIGYLGIPNPNYNPKKCIYWYTKACRKGHAEACNNLAVFYEKGECCEKNFNVSIELLQRSSNLGSVLGKKNLKIALKRLDKPHGAEF